MSDTQEIIKELCNYQYWIKSHDATPSRYHEPHIKILKEKINLLSEEQQINLIKYLIIHGKINNFYNNSLDSLFYNQNIIYEIIKFQLNYYQFYEPIDSYLYNKKIIIDDSKYIKLLEICNEKKSNQAYQIIYKYQLNDKLFNVNNTNDNKEKELEKKDHEILLLHKDKEIERLKMELEEMKKFYINS